jgi:hypothetical protein
MSSRLIVPGFQSSDSLTDVQETAVGTWVTQDITGLTGNRPNYNVVWSPDLEIFCTTDTGAVSLSTTGTGSWTTHSTASATKAWVGAEWSPELGIFCISGTKALPSFDEPATEISSDGQTWTSATQTELSGMDELASDLAWSPTLSLFVLVGHPNVAAYSFDGLNWTSVTMVNSNNNWEKVVWSPELSLFCAVGAGTDNRIATSTDGQTWTSQTSPNQEWKSIVWSPEKSIFVAVASTGTTRGMTSSDGITWTTVGVSGIPLEDFINVLWSPQLSFFIASSTASTIMSSTDGLTWTTRSVIVSFVTRGAWSPKLSLFVLRRSQTSTIATSDTDFSAYVQTSSYGTQAVTDISVVGKDITIGRSANNVTIGQYSSQVTIGSPGVDINILGTLSINDQQVFSPLFNVSRDIINDMSPVVWIANGDSVVGGAITLQNGTRVIHRSSGGIFSTTDGLFSWKLASTGNPSIDIASTISTGQVFTIAFAIDSPPQNGTAFGSITDGNTWFNQLVDEADSDANHTIASPSGNLNTIVMDEFTPSGGSTTMTDALPPFFRYGSSDGQFPKTCVVFRKNGGGSNKTNVFVNGFLSARSTWNETYNGTTPNFMRIGHRNNASPASSAYNFEISGFAAWSISLPDADIAKITYYSLSAP